MPTRTNDISTELGKKTFNPVEITRLNPGQRGQISSMKLPETIQEHLSGLGLNLGAEFTVIQGSAKTPWIIAVDQTRIALGNDLAANIFCLTKERKCIEGA